jgi:hypothetical protein
MIDLTLFHPEGAPEGADFRRKDQLNGWTRRRACRLLEWIGWYNYSIAQRLLGHYRLFQHFRVAFSKCPRDIPVVQAYIRQYRATHGVRYFLARAMSSLDVIVTPTIYMGVGDMAVLNRQLVSEPFGILNDFLTEADTDFTAALQRAIRRINQPDKTPISAPAIKGAQGKESGVFSKKQILLLFDLLSKSGNLDPIDLEKPNKFDAYADLLHALTGKSRQSFKEELHDYHTKGLYEWHTPGEFTQLINTLTQLLTYFEKAGFDFFANTIDKKIRTLRKERRS